MILLTGASGALSSEVARQLAERGVPFRGLIRNPDRAAAIEAMGGEVAVGDFDDVASLERALEGVDTAFLLAPLVESQASWERTFVDAALRAGLGHVVYLSMSGADVESPSRFGRSHAATEEYVRQVGMPYTFLRPNAWMENTLAYLPTIKEQNVFFSAIGDAPISHVAVGDIAAAAAAALTGGSPENRVYELTGPEALTFRGIADLLARATGRPIAHVDISAEQSEQYMLAAGLPQWSAEGLTELLATFNEGKGASVEPGVAELTGRQPISYDQWAQNTIVKMLAAPPPAG